MRAAVDPEGCYGRVGEQLEDAGSEVVERLDRRHLVDREGTALGLHSYLEPVHLERSDGVQIAPLLSADPRP